jgi:hypothetical protein
MTVSRQGTRWSPVVISVVAMAATLLPASPASAHQPEDLINLNPSHYNGDDRAHWHVGNEPRTNEAQVASDAFDGVDQLWTMRAASTAAAAYYEWYECETPQPGWTIWDPPGTCRLIATDTTPTLSTAPAGVNQVAVFEATWDLPSNMQFGRTFRTAACIDGPPSSAPHCYTDRTGVHFDDASSTSDHAQTDAGMIVQPVHGQAVANSGFTAVAYTSQSDIGRIQFCLDQGTNPFVNENANPAGGCDPGSARDSVPDDSPICAAVPASADCWSAEIDPPDEAEFSFGIVEQDDPTGPVESGAGDCDGDTAVGGDGQATGDDCQFDKIYMTSVANPPPPPPTPVPLPGGQSPPPAAQADCGAEGGSRNPVVGTEGDDTLVGTGKRDIICGFGGDDVLRGLAGADLLLGAAGDDHLLGGPGRDRLRGGPDRDRLAGGPGRDRCQGGPGRDIRARC